VLLPRCLQTGGRRESVGTREFQLLNSSSITQTGVLVSKGGGLELCLKEKSKGRREQVLRCPL